MQRSAVLLLAALCACAVASNEFDLDQHLVEELDQQLDDVQALDEEDDWEADLEFNPVQIAREQLKKLGGTFSVPPDQARQKQVLKPYVMRATMLLKEAEKMFTAARAEHLLVDESSKVVQADMLKAEKTRKRFVKQREGAAKLLQVIHAGASVFRKYQKIAKVLKMRKIKTHNIIRRGNAKIENLKGKAGVAIRKYKDMKNDLKAMLNHAKQWEFEASQMDSKFKNERQSHWKDGLTPKKKH